MTSDEASSIRTRPTLLNRLKTGDDAESWQEFYRIYGKLVRDFAIHAGLTDTEADEVVQETAIAVARNLKDFVHDPKRCRFKTWLLNQTSWRIKDQFRKRQRDERRAGGAPAGSPATRSSPRDDETRTGTVERVADPGALNLDELFETEWRGSLLAAAMNRVQAQFSLKQIQMFDLTTSKEWPAKDVARSLGVSIANVYVTRHRVSAALKKEMLRLEKEMESAVRTSVS